jgi:uncharacterized protein (TIGR00661 family)
MANILYGVAGEGMGHATRSKLVIDHLLAKGHKIHIVTSNRSFDFLKKSFPKVSVTEIAGLVLVYEDNKLNNFKSALANMKFKKGMRAFNTVKKIIVSEKIELIISDFEPTVAYMAGLIRFNGKVKKKIPLICIDNIHLLSNSIVNVPKKFKKDYYLAKYITKVLIPPLNVSRFLITSFFSVKIKNKKTQLIPSLLRDIIIESKPTQDNCIVVYQTSKSNTHMFDLLKKFNDEKFIIYGFDEDKKEHNLEFKKFSEKGFVGDLSRCKAVITNGGFSLMSEAVFLHKPVLSVPVKKQFEQICNALYLKKKGYGTFAGELNHQKLKMFIKNLHVYKKNLENYMQKDNQDALKKIDETINEVIPDNKRNIIQKK